MRRSIFYFLLFITSIVYSQSEIYYFKDTVGTIPYEEISNQKFSLLTQQILEPHSDDVYWFKFPAHETDSVYILRILYDRIHHADLYQQDQMLQKLPRERYVSYRFSREHDVYMRINPKLHSYIPLEFSTEREAVLKNKNQLLLNGFYYGFAILIIIYNLAYYYLFKDDAFLYYALLLSSMSLGVFIMDGMLCYFGVDEQVNDVIMMLNYICLAFFSSKFVNTYLFLDTYYPKLKKFSYSIGIAAIILSVLYLVLQNFYYLLVVNFLIFALLFTYWICTVVLFKKNIYTKMLAVGYVIVLFSGIDFFIFKFLGLSVIDINGATIKIGGFLEMIILSIAVLYRMNTLKEENRQMRNEIIKFSALQTHQDSSADKMTLLSVREREIFDQIVMIKTNKEIANDLNVSINTVKFHIKNIYEKLEIRSRKEVLSIAKTTVK